VDGEWVDGLDASGCADALAGSRAALVAAELEQVRLVAHWCDLHSGPTKPASVPGERMVACGGDGTPRVSEVAAGELGLLLQVSTGSARWMMRDVLDLRYRHPRLWEVVQAGVVRFFQARLVVRATRTAGLDLAQAQAVDARVAPYLGNVTWGRLESLAEAAVISADPEAAEQRRIDAEMRRFVRTGRSSEYSTKTIYARARAGDAVFFYAMCDRITQILKLQGCPEVTCHAGTVVHPADAAEQEMDVLRSLAIGILATPARALELLAWAERHEPDADQAEPEPEHEPDRPGQLVDLSTVPAGALVPPATLFVHMTLDQFEQRCRDAVDVADVGVVTVEQAVDLLGHCKVSLQPVVDLNESPAVDGYHVQGRVRRIVELRNPVEVFPWGTLPSSRADKDHITPYVPLDEGGPPGQTTPDNLAPLGRYHHRLKTHTGWSYQQTSPGVFYWRSPHGHWARVDASGSHYLGTHTPPEVRAHDSPPNQPASLRAYGPAVQSRGEQQLRHLVAGWAGLRLQAGS